MEVPLEEQGKIKNIQLQLRPRTGNQGRAWRQAKSCRAAAQRHGGDRSNTRKGTIEVKVEQQDISRALRRKAPRPLSLPYEQFNAKVLVEAIEAVARKLARAAPTAIRTSRLPAALGSESTRY